MKAKSKKLIGMIKGFLDVALVINYVVFALGLVLVVGVFIFEEYLHWVVTVNIPKYNFAEEIQMTSNQVKDVVLMTNEATLDYKAKNTPFIIISVLFFLCVWEVIVFTIIWHLRKVFANLNMGYPFTLENVISLKKVALCIVLNCPLAIIFYFFEQELVNSSFSEINQFSIYKAFELDSLIIGAILYIIAAIINEGIELKKENEEFV